MRAGQDGGHLDHGARSRGVGVGVPAMCFEASQDLVGQADRTQGILAGDPGTR